MFFGSLSNTKWKGSGMFHLVREVGKTGVILIKIKVTLSRLADKNMVKLWPFLLSLSLYSTLKYTFSLSVAIKNIETCIWIYCNFCTLGVKGWESNVSNVFSWTNLIILLVYLIVAMIVLILNLFWGIW